MTCPYHGYSTPCPTCQTEGQAFDRERARAGTWAYCIFEWRGDGKYRAQDAASPKRYKVKSAAQKRADWLNAGGASIAEGGYVVRFVPVS